jgi:hypothetical protein
VELTQASLLSIIDGVDAALPAALVPAAQRARLRSLARMLPFAPFVLLECHLATEAPRVDLSAGGRADSATGAALLAIAGLPSDALRAAETVLLEYDVDDEPERLRAPGVFAGFNVGAPPHTDAVIALATELRRTQWFDGADVLRRCLAALTPDLRITHVGVMAGRAPASVRLNVRTMRADALRRYAVAIGMVPERRAALDALLSDVEPFVQRLVLALDLGPEPQPRFGVECYPGVSGGPDHWPSFLERLLDRTLCTRAEYDALRDWAGSAPSNAMDEWPAARQRLAAFLGPRRPAHLARSLNHVKLVAEPGVPLRAKAYLAVNQSWHETPA